VADNSGLWSKPAPEENVSTPEQNTSVPDKQTQPTPPMKNIRWNMVDFFIGIGLTIVSQVIFAFVLIGAWLRDNGTNGLDPSNSNEVIDAIASYALQGHNLFISNMLLYASWLTAMWYASYRRGFKSFAKDFWLKFKWKRDILIGLGFALAFRVAEFGITNGLDFLGVDMSGTNNAEVITNLNGVWFIINAILIASIIGPFMEELFFRGLLLQALLKTFRLARPRYGDTSVDMTPLTDATGVVFPTAGQKIGSTIEKICAPFFKYRNALAALVSSVVFGFMHFQGTESFGQWFVVLWTGTLGFALSMVVYKYKSLGPAIFGHIFFNLSGVLLATFL
jgi:membrane protease YdiL (CAAX protease family)